MAMAITGLQRRRIRGVLELEGHLWWRGICGGGVLAVVPALVAVRSVGHQRRLRRVGNGVALSGGSCALGGHRLAGWWGVGVTVGGGALAGWHCRGGGCMLGGR